MAKPIIKWKTTPRKDIRTGRTVLVPMIVERTAPLDLNQLAYNAIDTGRIPGLKTSAAEGIGKGLAEQIGITLNSGRGLKFGEWFYVRPYLSGKVDSIDSMLSPTANRLRTRLMPGKALRLTNDSFSFENVVDDGDTPKIDYVMSDIAGAESGTLTRGETIAVIGENLAMGAGDSAAFAYEKDGEERTIALGAPATSGANFLKFEWPEAATAEALPTGTKATLRVTFARTIGEETTSIVATAVATVA